jgi:hypothetical protein
MNETIPSKKRSFSNFCFEFYYTFRQQNFFTEWNTQLGEKKIRKVCNKLLALMRGHKSGA